LSDFVEAYICMYFEARREMKGGAPFGGGGRIPGSPASNGNFELAHPYFRGSSSINNKE
jgi:hypothetical protein